MRTRPGPSWVIALLAVVLLGTGGCGNPDDPNYVSVETPKITVDRPAAWTTEVAVEAPWTNGFRAGPDSIDQIQVSGEFGEFVTAAQGMGSLIGQAQIGLKGFTVVQTRDLEVKGATTAQSVRYTVTDNAGSQLSGEWIVAAHWPYPQSIAVSILTPIFDPELERRVVESLEMRPVFN